MRENLDTSMVSKPLSEKPKSQKSAFAKLSNRSVNSKVSSVHTNVPKDHIEENLKTLISQKIVLSHLTTALEISLTGANLTYEVKLDDAAPHEIEFFERTLALLEGRVINKRFGSTTSLK